VVLTEGVVIILPAGFSVTVDDFLPGGSFWSAVSFNVAARADWHAAAAATADLSAVSAHAADLEAASATELTAILQYTTYADLYNVKGLGSQIRPPVIHCSSWSSLPEGNLALF